MLVQKQVQYSASGSIYEHVLTLQLHRSCLNKSIYVSNNCNYFNCLAVGTRQNIDIATPDGDCKGMEITLPLITLNELNITFQGLQNLPMAISSVLKLEPQIKQLAAELKDSKNLLLMGRGYQYATCIEGYELNIKLIAICCLTHSFKQST